MTGTRRSNAVDRRARKHLPIPDPQAPGCCTCGVRMDLKVRNEYHLDQLPAVDQAITDAERARLGERD